MELIEICRILYWTSLPFLRYIPVKYEKLREPTNDEPGLIRVHTIQEHEDGTKTEVTEEFNTVCFCLFLSLNDFHYKIKCIFYGMKIDYSFNRF